LLRVAENDELRRKAKLPLFVACLLSAIALTNTVPRLFPQIRWPSRTRGLALGARMHERFVERKAD
jgi:hypothetical protein